MCPPRTGWPVAIRKKVIKTEPIRKPRLSLTDGDGTLGDKFVEPIRRSYRETARRRVVVAAAATTTYPAATVAVLLQVVHSFYAAVRSNTRD